LEFDAIEKMVPAELKPKAMANLRNKIGTSNDIAIVN
jgi:hypothetical protein